MATKTTKKSSPSAARVVSSVGRSIGGAISNWLGGGGSAPAKKSTPAASGTPRQVIQITPSTSLPPADPYYSPGATAARKQTSIDRNLAARDKAKSVAASALAARNAAKDRNRASQAAADAAWAKKMNLKGSSITTARNPTGSSGTTAGTDPSFDFSGLVAGFNKAYGEARDANEARYQRMLAIADQTTQQQATDIRSAYGQQSSDISQQLARQGMGGTTVAPTMQFGVQREQQSALNRLADQMQQTKLGIIERREDEGPDLGAMQSILAGIGAQGPSAMQGAVAALSQLGTGAAPPPPAPAPPPPMSAAASAAQNRFNSLFNVGKTGGSFPVGVRRR